MENINEASVTTDINNEWWKIWWDTMFIVFWVLILFLLLLLISITYFVRSKERWKRN